MSEAYPTGYNPSAVVAQAQAYAPQAAPSFPQMTPGSSPYYGPTHAALSQAFQAALMQQMGGNGLLSQVTPQQMGLLSTDMPQAMAIPMSATGGGQLGPNQYYRLSPDFWNSVYQPPAAPVKTDEMDSAKNSTPYEHEGGNRNQIEYSGDYTRSNGSVGGSNGNNGPYSNGGGPGNSFKDGGLFGLGFLGL